MVSVSILDWVWRLGGGWAWYLGGRVWHLVVWRFCEQSQTTPMLKMTTKSKTWRCILSGQLFYFKLSLILHVAYSFTRWFLPSVSQGRVNEIRENSKNNGTLRYYVNVVYCVVLRQKRKTAFVLKFNISDNADISSTRWSTTTLNFRQPRRAAE